MKLLGIACFVLLRIAFSSCHPRPSFHWKNIDYVYSFGDSYSFILGLQGPPADGFFPDATHLAFTREQLFANEIIPNVTSSDGANWLEFLTGCFEGKPSNCRTQLWDFAHGAAAIDSALIPQSRNTTVQLNDQVRQWHDYTSRYLPRPQGRTLTTWWIGINDCTRICNNETIVDPDAFMDTDIDAYFRLINFAAQNGLRTHLILNLPPVDKSPFAVTVRTGPEGFRDMLAMFNRKLIRRVAEYSRAHPEQLVMLFDAAAVLNRILDHPHKYGFNDTTTFCTNCTDQRSFFWHDDEHPTVEVHRILAAEVEQFLLKH